jgi:ataxia telangiectasia mutated family protein
MVQIFSIIHTCLERSKEARKRGLGIRTYQVVPIQPLCGVLEWIEDSVPIGEYLTNAHDSYASTMGQGLYTSGEARERMKKEMDRENSTVDSKLAVYREILKKFPPVFRNLFWEKFPAPTEWYEKRLEYIRSVAVTCILGYIVGLGDRHFHNILIDQKTAQVIHIDLNMIFEQGKLLRIPEQVPFRLTRDMLDGMGAVIKQGGYDNSATGTFQRACEETLKVLRSKSDLVMTMLGVFQYDPLYRWPSSHQAERALIRVKSKLQGIEHGSSALSVQGHVNYMIQEATRQDLLCQMYPGWQAWM